MIEVPEGLTEALVGSLQLVHELIDRAGSSTAVRMNRLSGPDATIPDSEPEVCELVLGCLDIPTQPLGLRGRELCRQPLLPDRLTHLIERPRSLAPEQEVQTQSVRSTEVGLRCLPCGRSELAQRLSRPPRRTRGECSRPHPGS